MVPLDVREREESEVTLLQAWIAGFIVKHNMQYMWRCLKRGIMSLILASNHTRKSYLRETALKKENGEEKQVLLLLFLS